MATIRSIHIQLILQFVHQFVTIHQRFLQFVTFHRRHLQRIPIIQFTLFGRLLLPIRDFTRIPHPLRVMRHLTLHFKMN